ncbi:hemolysin XhlA [Serratia marcescens]|nr:hemolysin XhlA [Serratia marcescens]
MSRRLYSVPSDGNLIEQNSVSPHNSFDDGNGGGGDDMLERVKKLEDKLSTLAIDIAVIKSNYATGSDVAAVKTEVANAKADLHSALRLQALTIIGSMIAIISLASGIIIKFAHS